MKKRFAVLIASTYLFLFNYCLVYEVVTGEPHMPLSPASQAAETEDHPGCHGHQSSSNAGSQTHGDPRAPSGQDHSSSESDPCCVTLLCDSAVRLPTLQTVSKPVFSVEQLPAVLVNEVGDVPPSATYHRDHGPPLFASKDLLLSPLTSRAPPIL